VRRTEKEKAGLFSVSEEIKGEELTDEELGALLLVKARAEKKIAALTDQIKSSSVALLKLADALSADPDGIAVRGLPPGLEALPSPVGRKIEFDWAQIDTVAMVQRLIDLREAQASAADAAKHLSASPQL
jgi:hypothetical protein